MPTEGQLEWFKTNVDEKSVKVGGTQLITTLDGYSVPLLIKDGLAYATSLGNPTDQDMDTYPHMSVKCTRRTLHMPNFTRAPLAEPSLSNFPKWESNFGELTHSHRMTNSDNIFQLPPPKKIPNSHIVQYLSYTQNECHAHPNWAPTKEPTVSCWRYTPTPKQDRFQDLLDAICPDFLHTTITK